MNSIILFSLLLQASVNHVNLVIAESLYGNVFRCRNTGNFPPNSPYQMNLMSALNSLPDSTANTGGFSIESAGNKPNETVFAVALCAGYLKSEDCKNCVKRAIPLIRKNCPNQKEGVAWMLKCMVRYGDKAFYKSLDAWFWVHLTSEMKVNDKDTELVDKLLYNLAVRLSTEAASGGHITKYAFGTEKFRSQNVYMVIQCTPDISTDDCNKCFLPILVMMHPCCSGRVAAAMLSPNCYMRYAHSDFRIL